MKPDLSCLCGGRLFAASSVFQTIENKPVFKLANSTGSRENVWALRCLGCGDHYLMSGDPREHGNTLLPEQSLEAKALLEKYSTDGIFTEEDSVDVSGS